MKSEVELNCILYELMRVDKMCSNWFKSKSDSKRKFSQLLFGFSVCALILNFSKF